MPTNIHFWIHIGVKAFFYAHPSYIKRKKLEMLNFKLILSVLNMLLILITLRFIVRMTEIRLFWL